MISNNLTEELKKLDIDYKVVDNDNICFTKNGESVTVKISSLRKLFLDSLVSHIDLLIQLER